MENLKSIYFKLFKSFGFSINCLMDGNMIEDRLVWCIGREWGIIQMYNGFIKDWEILDICIMVDNRVK